MTQKHKMTGSQKAGASGLALMFAVLIAGVISVEGDYVNDPNDPGGPTNKGVTERSARENGYTGDMRNLTDDQAADIYARKYILKPGYGPIVEADFYLAEEILDTGVNAGPARASRWFQESLNHLNRRGVDYPDIVEDGLIGPATMSAHHALQQKRGKKLACQLLVKLMDAKQAGHYMALGGKNSKFETFIPGWTRTRIGNVDLDKCGSDAWKREAR